MNTLAHAVINLLLFGKRHREAYPVAIVVGAILPDASMMLFYLWEKLQSIPERVIWREHYFMPGWQALFDSFHAFPLLLLACWLAWRQHMHVLTIVFASMICHSLFDFPVHHDDAHRHFWPFSDYRFASPISYWDPAYHGLWISGLALVIVMAGGVWMWRDAQNVVLTRCIAILTVLYLIFWGFAVIIWI